MLSEILVSGILSALKKFGVTQPDQLEGDKKKEFYDYIDKNWKSDKEKETGKEDPKENYLIVCKNQTCSNKIKNLDELKSVEK